MTNRGASAGEHGLNPGTIQGGADGKRDVVER